MSILYALDLGGLFTVLAVLGTSILADKDKPSKIMKHYTLKRNTQLIGAAIFFVSALPFFWTLKIPVGDGIPLRFMLWIIPLFLHNIRRAVEKRT